jgi:RHS repeat-associated protein
MNKGRSQDPKQKDSVATERINTSAPSISLPKGGGAIRGIGEKFAANPVNGTGSFSIPIAMTQGGGGLTPELTLSYNSGSGNSSIGFGWSLSLPEISRKTEKSLPRYRDENEEDTFVFSGAEDLVPFTNDEGLILQDVLVSGYNVRRFRPRIESSFQKIERWTRASNRSDVHWRVYSKENILSVFGRDANSRISNPSDPTQIFSWLLAETWDDKGNVVQYRYKAEDGSSVGLSQAHERNRGDANSAARKANRYIKHIFYGNRTPLVDASGNRPVLFDFEAHHSLIAAGYWMFQLTFDYGEHDILTPTTNEVDSWKQRPDAFSTYRSGFEVRTARLCRRVLCFHHFPDEPDVGVDCLVRSTELTHANTLQSGWVGSDVGYAKIVAITHASFQRTTVGYLRQAMPPVNFTYSEPTIDAELHGLIPDDLGAMPIGAHSEGGQWVDLHGESLAGFLKETNGAWYYTRNISPISSTQVSFAPTECVKLKPSFTLAGTGGQLTSLSGEGGPDLVVLDGPTPGVFLHDEDESWQDFHPLVSDLTRSVSSPDAKLIDLDGDGRSDLMISEDGAFLWHPSLGNGGFGAAERIALPLDEELGPRVVFSNSSENIYLADLSGDGLADLVRIRNGEVCYWPNLGYCRFGPKVTMDNAPFFDVQDQFDPKRFQISDIDGSGTADLIYLHRDGIKIYFNRSGNSWSDAISLPRYAGLDDTATVTVTDLRGNGTASLVWSSKLPQDRAQPMRYVNLMGAQKPHLLIKVDNNLGAETNIHYVTSTKFYLQDKRDGRPWITKLAFPVHVVEKVETIDHISRNRFITLYAYHHGYFDKAEREFRGFGMVEQWDSEAIAGFNASSSSNWSSNDNLAPILTKTWYHTGQYLWRDRVSNYYAGLSGVGSGEYFREPGLSDAEAEKLLLPDTLLPEVLTLEEERDACRSLKGSMLRQEVYAVDGSLREGVPFSVSEQNFTLRKLQPRKGKSPAVIMVAPREKIEFHYERNATDPRIQHALTLEVDGYGNPLLEVAIGYGRRQPNLDLPTAVDQQKQTRPLITLKQNLMTNANGDLAGVVNYRTPLPAETKTFEITGLQVLVGQVRFSFSDWISSGGNLLAAATDISYEQTPNLSQVQKRQIEHVRMHYRPDDLGDASGNSETLLPLGVAETRGIAGETFQFAYTPGLIANAYTRDGTPLIPDVNAVLSGGGYVSSQELKIRGVFPGTDPDGEWWRPSGRAYFSINALDTSQIELAIARQNFFNPRRYRDPFGAETIVDFDTYNLLPKRAVDALNNETLVESYDYRVMQPNMLRDPNGNRTAAKFDVLGLVAGTAVMGKAGEQEGDTLDGFNAVLPATEIDGFFNATEPGLLAHNLLRGATSRVIYDVDRFERSKTAFPNNPEKWQPSYAATITRETHVSNLAPGELTKLQLAFSFSDGFGREIQKKVQAEPGPTPLRDVNGAIIVDADGYPLMTSSETTPRWAASGWTIFNNKGKPVRQYEPFFSDTHKHEFGVIVGVSPVLFYDPAGRVIATLHPNHCYEKVTFDPWLQVTHDVSDTVLLDPRTDPDVAGGMAGYFTALNDPTWKTWYQRRISGALGVVEKDAAEKSAGHAGTPTTAHLDVLGRPFLTFAHNRVVCENHVLDGTEALFATRVELDIEGNQLAVRDATQQADDALGRVVMRFAVDVLGRPVFQHGMDGGRRWTLPDIADQPLLSWDERGEVTRTEYDALRRPIAMWLQNSSGAEKMTTRTTYGESLPQPELKNQRMKPVKLCDQAGVVTTDSYDFKGNALGATRQLAKDYKSILDWSQAVPLEPDIYKTATRFDAMNRPVEVTSPDGSVLVPGYNEAGLLERVETTLRGSTTPTAFVTDIDYDAKGQRQMIAYGNSAVTTSSYDPETFRLIAMKTTRTGFPADESLLQDLSYTYDPAGNLTTIRDDAQQVIYFNNQRVEPTTSYTYDAVHRLIEAKGREHLGQTGGSMNAPTPSDAFDDFRRNLAHPGDGNAMGTYIERYVYDAVGNFLQLQHRGSSPANAGWTRKFAYGAASLVEAGKTNNRLTMTSLGNGSDEIYDYDSHGNMLAMPHLPVMQWNHLDQLQATARQVVSGGGTAETTYYTYDAGGERVRKVTERQTAAGQAPTRKSERIYLGGFEIYREFASDGVIVDLERETLHIMDDQRRIALVETRTKGDDGSSEQLQRYQMGNHLGSASLELDDAAAIISYEEYLPYGSTSYHATRNQSEAPKRYRYTGKERDEETGLNYHSARYYAPWLTRWVSVDPIGIGDGVNVYNYCGCNPLNLSDLTGNEGEEPDPKAKKREQLAKSSKQGKKANSNVKSLMNDKGHAPVAEELPINKGKKVSKGDSRIDLLYENKALETKGRNPLSKSYLDKNGNFNSALKAKLKEDFKQVAKHEEALKALGVHHVKTKKMVKESLVYDVSDFGLDKNQTDAFRKFVREEAKIFKNQTGKKIFTGVTNASLMKVPGNSVKTGKVISEISQGLTHVSGSKASAHVLSSAAKTAGKLGAKAAKIIPVVGWVAGAASLSYNLSQGDYLGATLDAIGFVPIVGDAVDLVMFGIAVGEALPAANPNRFYDGSYMDKSGSWNSGRGPKY